MLYSFQDVQLELVPLMTGLGFNRRGNTFRQVTDQTVLVVNFQKSRRSDEFYVNLGAQPLFVPTVIDERADTKRIQESECIFRKRVGPPSGSRCWPSSLDDSLLELLHTELKTDYEDFLTPLATFPGPLTEFSVGDFTGKPHPLLGGRGAASFLHLSRIASGTGQPEKAVAFAEWGISLCSKGATGMIARLQDALAEAQSNCEGWEAEKA